MSPELLVFEPLSAGGTALGQLAKCLTGPGITRSPLQDLRDAIAACLESGRSGAKAHADILLRWMRGEVTDLEHELAGRPGRGRSNMKIPRLARMQARDEEIRRLAATLDGKPTKRARELVELVLARDPRALVLRQHQDVPECPRHVVRILRSKGQHRTE